MRSLSAMILALDFSNLYCKHLLSGVHIGGLKSVISDSSFLSILLSIIISLIR